MTTISKVLRNFILCWNLTPGYNTWVFLVCGILLHLVDPGPPVWFVTQVVQICLSADRCPLSSLCPTRDNYTFDHLSKSLLLRMRTCWLIHQLLPSSSFSCHHVTPTRQLTAVQRIHPRYTQTWYTVHRRRDQPASRTFRFFRAPPTLSRFWLSSRLLNN